MKYIRRICCAFFIFLTANFVLLYAQVYSVIYRSVLWGVVFVAGFLIINMIPDYSNRHLPKRKYRICADGCELLIYFLISTCMSILYLIMMIPVVFTENKELWLWNLVCVILVEAVTFWNGIIRIYLSSSQIGIKWRVIGVICGWIPVVNLAVLIKIIRMASAEWRFESEKILQAQERKEDRLCETKYPLLLVHGVFFRDFKYFNYWGRIPKELEAVGAFIYYGNHQSAASVVDSGREIADRIMEIVKETGCEKVNIIAHSKGGLDCRYAISRLGMDQYVASLTTINTPHRGCEFADYLLNKIPESVKEKVANTYNASVENGGGLESPDFISAVTDLTASACERFNQEVPDVPGVYYQSVGSKLNVASGGRFPLNFSHYLVEYFDGAE